MHELIIYAYQFQSFGAVSQTEGSVGASLVQISSKVQGQPSSLS